MTRLLAATVLCLLAAPALAEQNCRTMDEAVAELTGKYHERLAGRGVSSSGYMLMLFLNPDGSTWTLMAQLKDGKTVCTMDAGEGFQFVSPNDQPVVEGEES